MLGYFNIKFWDKVVKLFEINLSCLILSVLKIVVEYGFEIFLYRNVNGYD